MKLRAVYAVLGCLMDVHGPLAQRSDSAVVALNPFIGVTMSQNLSEPHIFFTPEVKAFILFNLPTHVRKRSEQSELHLLGWERNKAVINMCFSGGDDIDSAGCISRLRMDPRSASHYRNECRKKNRIPGHFVLAPLHWTLAEG